MLVACRYYCRLIILLLETTRGHIWISLDIIHWKSTRGLYKWMSRKILLRNSMKVQSTNTRMSRRRRMWTRPLGTCSHTCPVHRHDQEWEIQSFSCCKLSWIHCRRIRPWVPVCLQRGWSSCSAGGTVRESRGTKTAGQSSEGTGSEQGRMLDRGGTAGTAGRGLTMVLGSW